MQVIPEGGVISDSSTKANEKFNLQDQIVRNRNSNRVTIPPLSSYSMPRVRIKISIQYIYFQFASPHAFQHTSDTTKISNIVSVPSPRLFCQSEMDISNMVKMMGSLRKKKLLFRGGKSDYDQIHNWSIFVHKILCGEIKNRFFQKVRLDIENLRNRISLLDQKAHFCVYRI